MSENQQNDALREGGENGAVCTTSSDCKEGLVCIDGKCVPDPYKEEDDIGKKKENEG